MPSSRGHGTVGAMYVPPIENAYPGFREALELLGWHVLDLHSPVENDGYAFHILASNDDDQLIHVNVRAGGHTTIGPGRWWLADIALDDRYALDDDTDLVDAVEELDDFTDLVPVTLCTTVTLEDQENDAASLGHAIRALAHLGLAGDVNYPPVPCTHRATWARGPFADVAATVRTAITERTGTVTDEPASSWTEGTPGVGVHITYRNGPSGAHVTHLVAEHLELDDSDVTSSIGDDDGIGRFTYAGREITLEVLWDAAHLLGAILAIEARRDTPLDDGWDLYQAIAESTHTRPAEPVDDQLAQLFCGLTEPPLDRHDIDVEAAITAYLDGTLELARHVHDQHRAPHDP